LGELATVAKFPNWLPTLTEQKFVWTERVKKMGEKTIATPDKNLCCYLGKDYKPSTIQNRFAPLPHSNRYVNSPGYSSVSHFWSFLVAR